MPRLDPCACVTTSIRAPPTPRCSASARSSGVDDTFNEGLRLPAAISRQGPDRRARCAATVERVRRRQRVWSRLCWIPSVSGHAVGYRRPTCVAFHPGKTARIEIDGRQVGIVGGLHPAVEEELKIDGPCWIFELDLEQLLEYCPRRVVYRDLPRFPMVVRDLAVVAEESFASDQVIRFVKAWTGGGNS